jgi:hypothetical protein
MNIIGDILISVLILGVMYLIFVTTWWLTR